MDFTYGTLEKIALKIRRIESPGTDFSDHVKRLANLALTEVTAADSRAILPEVERIVLNADIETDDADVGAYLKTTSDTKVLELVDSAGTALPQSALTSWVPDTKGGWDGIKWLELTNVDDNNRRHRFQTREWWKAGDPGSEHFYVSLMRPFTYHTSGAVMKVRIHEPFFYLPARVVKIAGNPRVYDDTRYVQSIRTEREMDAKELIDYFGEDDGPPLAISPANEVVRLPSPETAPVLEFIEGAWVGTIPSQQGRFRFFYTYTMGRKDPEFFTSPGSSAIVDPFWESAPSPLSDAIDHATAVPGSEIIRVLMNNIDAELGFDVAGTLRESHSGIKIRLYVLRETVITSAAHPQQDADSRPLLLAEIDPTSGTVTPPPAKFEWDGSVHPDKHRQYRDTSAYKAWKVYPQPDKRYEMDVPVLLKPEPIRTKQQRIPIQDTHVSVFLRRFLMWLCEDDGIDAAEAERHAQHFMLQLGGMTQQESNRAAVVQPGPIRRRGRSQGPGLRRTRYVEN